MHHGPGGRKDERPVDRERFFRIIDREILERASKVSGLPLVLAALREHQAHFLELSHKPFLAATGIELNPGAWHTLTRRGQMPRPMRPRPTCSTTSGGVDAGHRR